MMKLKSDNKAHAVIILYDNIMSCFFFSSIKTLIQLGTIQKRLLGGGGFSIFVSKIWVPISEKL